MAGDPGALTQTESEREFLHILAYYGTGSRLLFSLDEILCHGPWNADCFDDQLPASG
jgi:hypothetical protein